MHSIKIRNSKFKISLQSKGGQSLVEVLVGLTIGVVIIGVAAFAITGTLRANVGIDRNQSALNLAQDLLGKVRSWSGQNWQNAYSLTKGTDTKYFLNASGSTLFIVQGEEGVLDNNVISGLVGEWKFDQDVDATSTTAYDSTGNNNHATLVNSPTRASSTCIVGNCLSFNGLNSYLLITDPLSEVLDPTTQYTLSVWIKTTSSNTYEFIVSKTSGGSGGGYELFMTSGKIRFSSCDASGSCTGGYFDITTDASYNDGLWHLIIATVKTDDVAQIYVDGVFVKQSSTVTQSNIANNYNLVIGGRGPTGSNPFNGLLDDVRIYNRQLSSDEVKQLYGAKIFTRSFSIENACRTNDSSSTISGAAPCGGGSSDDPSTQKVSVRTNWISNGTTTQSVLTDYITRWQNAVFQQADWSGGIDASSTYTNSATTFSSSTNTATTTNGAIKLQGI